MPGYYKPRKFKFGGGGSGGGGEQGDSDGGQGDRRGSGGGVVVDDDDADDDEEEGVRPAAAAAAAATGDDDEGGPSSAVRRQRRRAAIQGSRKLSRAFEASSDDDSRGGGSDSGGEDGKRKRAAKKALKKMGGGKKKRRASDEPGDDSDDDWKGSADEEEEAAATDDDEVSLDVEDEDEDGSGSGKEDEEEGSIGGSDDEDEGDEDDDEEDEGRRRRKKTPKAGKPAGGAARAASAPRPKQSRVHNDRLRFDPVGGGRRGGTPSAYAPKTSAFEKVGYEVPLVAGARPDSQGPRLALAIARSRKSIKQYSLETCSGMKILQGAAPVAAEIYSRRLSAMEALAVSWSPLCTSASGGGGRSGDCGRSNGSTGGQAAPDAAVAGSGDCAEPAAPSAFVLLAICNRAGQVLLVRQALPQPGPAPDDAAAAPRQDSPFQYAGALVTHAAGVEYATALAWCVVPASSSSSSSSWCACTPAVASGRDLVVLVTGGSDGVIKIWAAVADALKEKVAFDCVASFRPGKDAPILGLDVKLMPPPAAADGAAATARALVVAAAAPAGTVHVWRSGLMADGSQLAAAAAAGAHWSRPKLHGVLNVTSVRIVPWEDLVVSSGMDGQMHCTKLPPPGAPASAGLQPAAGGPVRYNAVTSVDRPAALQAALRNRRAIFGLATSGEGGGNRKTVCLRGHQSLLCVHAPFTYSVLC